VKTPHGHDALRTKDTTRVGKNLTSRGELLEGHVKQTALKKKAREPHLLKEERTPRPGSRIRPAVCRVGF